MSSVLSNGQLTVPDGLPAALESLARAVLKEQPTDLANFAATHFRVLLSQRSGKSSKSSSNYCTSVVSSLVFRKLYFDLLKSNYTYAWT